MRTFTFSFSRCVCVTYCDLFRRNARSLEAAFANRFINCPGLWKFVDDRDDDCGNNIVTCNKVKGILGISYATPCERAIVASTLHRVSLLRVIRFSFSYLMIALCFPSSRSTLRK